MAQYKQWYRLSDLWQRTNLPATKDALIQRMAYRGALTVDTIIRDTVFSAGGTAQIGGTAVARTSMKRNGSFSMDVAELREAKRTLNNNNVPVFGNGLYVGIINPISEYDLQGKRLPLLLKFGETLKKILQTIPNQAQKIWEGVTTIRAELSRKLRYSLNFTVT